MSKDIRLIPGGTYRMRVIAGGSLTDFLVDFRRCPFEGRWKCHLEKGISNSTEREFNMKINATNSFFTIFALLETEENNE